MCTFALKLKLLRHLLHFSLSIPAKCNITYLFHSVHSKLRDSGHCKEICRNVYRYCPCRWVVLQWRCISYWKAKIFRVQSVVQFLIKRFVSVDKDPVFVPYSQCLIISGSTAVRRQCKLPVIMRCGSKGFTLQKATCIKLRTSKWAGSGR